MVLPCVHFLQTGILSISRRIRSYGSPCSQVLITSPQIFLIACGKIVKKLSLFITYCTPFNEKTRHLILNSFHLPYVTSVLRIPHADGVLQMRIYVHLVSFGYKFRVSRKEASTYSVYFSIRPCTNFTNLFIEL